jgi:hypothetical protein
MRPSPCRFLGEAGGETEEVASRSKNEEDLTIRGKTALLLARLSQSGEREKIGKRKVWGSGLGVGSPADRTENLPNHGILVLLPLASRPFVFSNQVKPCIESIFSN